MSLSEKEIRTRLYSSELKIAQLHYMISVLVQKLERENVVEKDYLSKLLNSKEAAADTLSKRNQTALEHWRKYALTEEVTPMTSEIPEEDTPTTSEITEEDTPTTSDS
jgi:hypothetical protein